jgi:hypothetical protein
MFLRRELFLVLKAAGARGAWLAGLTYKESVGETMILESKTGSACRDLAFCGRLSHAGN